MRETAKPGCNDDEAKKIVMKCKAFDHSNAT
jgi:hypothetical protein